MENNNEYIMPPIPSDEVMHSIEEHASVIDYLKQEMFDICGMKKSDFEKHFKRR